MAVAVQVFGNDNGHPSAQTMVAEEYERFNAHALPECLEKGLSRQDSP